MRSQICRSFSSRDTEALARRLAQDILAPAAPKAGAVVVALKGNLGAGKTTFVRGFFRGLGLRARVISPTFILMRRTTIRRRRFRNVYHADAYRATVADFAAIGFRDILADPANIVLVEWPERIARLLPKTTLRVLFSHGRRAHERVIRLARLR